MYSIGCSSSGLAVKGWVTKLCLLLTLFSVSLLFTGNIYKSPQVFAAPTANAYYVAPNGNNNNPGTLSQPWQTIAFAASNPVVKPGDTVYLRGGVYNEYVQTKISGQPYLPVTFRNYPGEVPVLTGTDAWRWDVLDQSHIRIQGITFRDFGKGGIQLRTKSENMTDIVISGCVFENQSQLNGDGAKTVHITTTVSGYNLTNVTVEGNVFTNIDSGDHPSLQLAGNVSGIKVLNNTFSSTSSISIGVAGRPDTGQPKQILIKGNNISGHGSPGNHSPGIYLDGAAERILVEENRVHSGQQGIKVSLEPAASNLQSRYIIIRRNVLYNNDQINLKLGTGNDSDNCNDSGYLEKSVAVNNTIFSEIAGPTNIQFSCGVDLRWKNNLVAFTGVSTGFQYKFGNSTADSSSWVLNHNFFYETNGSKSIRWDGVTYDSLAGFQTAVGQDLQSLSGNAAFVDMTQKDFSLKPESDAFDAGGPLTHTAGNGSGTVLAVEEAWYFSDGLGLQAGDRIRVGDNTAVTVVGVNYLEHKLTVNQPIAWTNGEPVYYEFANAAPDIGADEHPPLLILHAVPMDQQVRLLWETNMPLPDSAVWRIEYVGPAGNQSSPITVGDDSVRAYDLSGLSNYFMYEVTLTALVDNVPILSEQRTVMPTDIFVYLPTVGN
ncbi:MAG: right-handed parallel beta-helix repeat-containing protein [Anaerolineaceae bacterium]|nr:right-handed parallel beta-helix repeat-containing protein [Anaerolineaceae bacterium]